MWNEIKNEKQLSDFMDMMCGFHDSCIKEFKYLSGAYVTENLSMYPINDQRRLSIVFQRQFENPSVVEMEFLGLKLLKLLPVNELYTCEIFAASMFFHNGYLYWYDDNTQYENLLEDYNGTIICAASVRWRTAEEYIGQKIVYEALR